MRLSPTYIFLVLIALATASCQQRHSLSDFGDFRMGEFGVNEFASAIPSPKKLIRKLNPIDTSDEILPDSDESPTSLDEVPVISDSDPVKMMARAEAAADTLDPATSPAASAPAPMLVSTHPGTQPGYTPAPTLAPTASTIESARDVRRSTPSDFVVKTTAYTHLEADSLPYGTKSALGEDLKFGQVRSAAADWSRYPVGTRFKIKGLPYEYVVEDYGSALVDTDTIDLYKPNFSAMNQWGARDVGIEVLEWGSFEESRRILESRKHKPSADHVRKMLRNIEKKIEQIPKELRDGFSA